MICPLFYQALLPGTLETASANYQRIKDGDADCKLDACMWFEKQTGTCAVTTAGMLAGLTEARQERQAERKAARDW